MSKPEIDLPERLRAAGATRLERRLLEAAGREEPSRELSERMARAIGVSLVPGGGAATGSAKTDSAAVQSAGASKSLLLWLSGALVAVGVVVSALIVSRPSAKSSSPVTIAPPPLSAPATPPALTPIAPTPSTAAQSAKTVPDATEESTPRTAAPQATRGRGGTAGAELANQIALVDAARSALARGSAQRALAIVRDYQSEYPKGTFRPEVAAVKIEALIKLGRTTEARSLAERFVVAYGPGPLADRVARLAHLAEP